MAPLRQFIIRTKLLHDVLQSAGATETLFTARQIITYLGNYIEQRKLHDMENMKIVHCKGDQLENLFGVQEFTIDTFEELWKFIYPHIIPATNKEIEQLKNADSASGSSTCDGTYDKDVDNSERDYHWMMQLPWWFFVQKEKDDKNDNEVATASGSIIGKSTIYVEDTDYSSLSTSIASDDRFSIEFEPDSCPDSDSDVTEPASCGSEDETTYSTPSIPFTDSSESTITEDFWSCQECPNMNPPHIGYCQQCWKLRPGWHRNVSPVGTTKLPICQTLPTNINSDPVPPLPRSYSHPVGVDVADGKNHSLNSTSAVSNFNTLPFNQKRRKNSSDEGCGPPDKKPTMNDSSSNDVSSSKQSGTQCSPGQDPPTAEPKLDNPPLNSQNQQDSSVSEPKPAKVETPPNRPTHPGPCNICHSNPNNASFVHETTGHQYCCYKCALKLQRGGKNCPVCRQPIKHVIRNFIYEM